MTTPAPAAGLGAWNDRFLDRLESWRWPLPVTFLALAVATIGGLHAVEWWLGGLTPGVIDPFLCTLPAYPLGVLGLIAIQNRVSVAALARFRPATDLDDAGFATIVHELTHQPALSALVSGIALGALGLITELSTAGAGERVERYPVAFAIYLLVTFAFYAPAGPWILRTYRLLQRIHRLHGSAPNVNILRPEPVHAFSSVTATVGISFIAITSLSVATDPATLQTVTGVILTVVLLAFAVACFVLPLWGMHRRLEGERSRLTDDVARRIEATVERLYDHVDQDRAGATEVRDRLAALMATRDLIGKLSTWPWQPETPRWLISALLVPLMIWGATRVLERAFA